MSNFLTPKGFFVLGNTGIFKISPNQFHIIKVKYYHCSSFFEGKLLCTSFFLCTVYKLAFLTLRFFTRPSNFSRTLEFLRPLNNIPPPIFLSKTILLLEWLVQRYNYALNIFFSSFRFLAKTILCT
jgi:hypothetical protein